MTWNDEKVAKLEELWRTALYASQIAEQIGGVTRNAVIGKAHRLGLPMRGKPTGNAQRRPKSHRRVRSTAAAARAATIRPINPLGGSRMGPPAMKADPLPDPHEFDQARLASGDSQLIGDDLKAHHCRWPVGAPDLVNWRLCCLPREPGLPYCEHHLQRASAALKPVKAIRNIQHVETGHLTVAANVAEFLEPA